MTVKGNIFVKRFRPLATLGMCVVLASPVHAQRDIAAQVYRKASNSVVTVEVTDKTGKKVQGSGVVIKSEKGSGSIIVTNAHVVSTATTIRIMHKKSTSPATLWYAFNENLLDLAFLKVDQQLESAAFRGKEVETGNSVFAIGSPLGLQASISTGIVAGKRESKSTPLLQTTAAISPGSSGGGLFDADAKLVGITSFKIARGDGLNFAIDAGAIPAFVIGIATTKDFQDAVLKNGFVEVSKGTAESLESDSFTMWLTTEVIKSKYELAKLVSVGAAVARSENVKDPGGFIQKLQGIFSGLIRSWEMTEIYQSMQLSRGLNSSSAGKADSQENPQSPKSKGAITLQCVLTAPSDGSKIEKTLQVDFEREMVDGLIAKITDNTVRFSMGEFIYVLSRISGRLVVGTVEFPQIYAGPCETVTSRKF